MSGPKIIHIVTREEIVAICQAHLGRLDAAIAEWTRICERIGISETELAAVVARRDALRQLLASDRLTELQKHVPAEISFLQADAEDRIQKAAAREADARKSQRRTLEVAHGLLEALERSGRVIPDELRQNLGSRTVSKATLETAINRAFELLGQSEKRDISEQQRELAKKLGQGEARITLADWIARHPSANDDSYLLQIDKHLFTLSRLDVDVRSFEARAAAIDNSPLSQRGLLADSLAVELAETLKRARDQARRLADLRALCAELSSIGSEGAGALVARIEHAIGAKELNDAENLAQNARQLLHDHAHGVATAERRRAVLQGLAALGYSVTEGMNTAWVKDGRIVVQRTNNPGYGVEVGGGTQSNRFQVRAVAFGNSDQVRDSGRDRDMETIWCGDFGHLQALVAQNGGNIEVERALEVGSVPLKVIAISSDAETETIDVLAPRTLQR